MATRHPFPGGPANRPPARARTRRLVAVPVVALVAATVALVAACAGQELASPSSSSSWPGSSMALPFVDVPRHEDQHPLGPADGAVPEGTTVFDDEVPGVANLDPALLAALRQAATDAADDGVELQVNSGWRSAAYQDQLLRQAISEYGSAEEAARWVATAETSLHVAGDAVDIGPAEAAEWLSEHGDEHGLCAIYDNEPWHYELRPQAIDIGCPPRYADPTEDPRLQR